MMAGQTLRKRGTPLAMLAVLMGGWVALRAATWDSPLVYPAMAMAQTPQNGVYPANSRGRMQNASMEGPAPHSAAYPHLQGYSNSPLHHARAQYGGAGHTYPVYPQVVVYGVHPAHLPPGAYPYDPRQPAPPRAIAYGYPQYAGYAAPYPQGGRAHRGASPFPLAPHLGPRHGGSVPGSYGLNWHLEEGRVGVGVGAGSPAKRQGKRYAVRQEARPPFGVPISPASQASNDRWLLDAYGFYRQGSSALSVSQGRQPIYGASQIAANLQWRARPSSRHDPRVYARAYQALVIGGESELAAGVSARPLGSLPVRFYGELRATQNPAISDQGSASRTDFRPAAYAATEIPPQKLPLGFALEAYGAGGYVGGNASTYFVDGQAVAARPLTRIGKRGIGTADVSIGAGVWGGAQKGVSRVDVGPTLRFDVDIGKIPARVSVDYREKVAGDAEPDSGVAATVSTRF